MIVSSVPWMDDRTPTSIEKRKNFSLSPSPQNPKKKKNWPHWLHTEPSSVPAWNFYYGPIPLHNRMDIYYAINRAEWAIPWNSGVLQFKKGPRPPPLFALDGWKDGWMTGRMDDKMNDGTDGWKGRRRPDNTNHNKQNLKYYISRLTIHPYYAIHSYPYHPIIHIT
jgi:hypothetical protein